MLVINNVNLYLLILNKRSFLMIYVRVENNEILDVTNNINADFEEVNVNNLDDAVDYFSDKDWRHDESVVTLLESLFTEEEENVLEIYDIKVSTENRSFNELADMFSEKEIEIPDMQRSFVWDTNKCSKLIESILIGLPIPPLFFMDKGDNRYEVIDGLQRLTAISNFILGNNWGNITNSVQRNNTAKLSPYVDPTIRGKKFVDLTASQQKKIKRSTITVIDFRQIGSEGEKAKYLIFERINTGSELLNPMQIRKALAYGSFMSSLYEAANNSTTLISIFGKQYLNKDRHVEFMLGVYATYKVLKNEYELKSQYQKYILNDFCEHLKDEIIEMEFVENFNEQLMSALDFFEKKDIFKKVDKEGNYHGNRNNNISEVFLATAILEKITLTDEVEKSYKDNIYDNIDKFAINKVNKDLLEQRYRICKGIFGVGEND
ncbi:DUF262 domain-containing protein [Listeria monocytogenes]|nr:DUF262 domain-containing protein [Listeria monocytogenes]EAF4458981.1 DUF262 domain-containing protein [Listeria monocytogenes serotype 1/2a]EAD7000743.1 DUF262 domain-containing protein [Listeria monocytogenes]EAG9257983.1 DUF262 domain-containing protein [Listeria monocytogenes]EAG9270163.1 DUF262 domain-containing protein [Listeria monocytogenes]ECW8665239.1 DUF262 domain-containing protein [Listeria monocytogenes]